MKPFQIMSARQCAMLKKRMWNATLAARVEGRCLDGEATFVRYMLHPKYDLKQRRLPSVAVYYCDDQHMECGFLFVARSRQAAKVIRRFLLATLPSWPDIDAMPVFDGWACDDDCWFDMGRTT